MMRSRRRAGAFALACLAILGGAALSCGRAPSTEVVFWEFWPAEIVQPLLDRFEHEHPGVHVRLEQLTWQSGQEKIAAAVGADHVPDLCEVGSTWMPRLLAGGKLAEWTSSVEDLRPELRGWSLCSIGDHAYGLPWVMGTRALFYNKTLFAKAGLDSTKPPETWDDLYAAAEAIQKLGGGVHGYGVQAGERYILFKKFMPFAWGNGGRILSDDQTAAVFDSPQNLAALEFYLKLRDVGLIEHQDELDRQFKDGRLGLEISGAWLFKSIPRDAPRLRYGVALVPRPDLEHGTHASFAGGEVLVGFKAAKQQAAALQLARFLVRADNALALSIAAKGVQPAAVAADTAAYYREHPAEQVMIQQFETAVPTPNHPAWGDMEAAIEDEIEQALLGKKTPRQALSDANQKLAQLVAKP
ncbi:MAG TPA: extracellular solute-binding protein [Candidatus Saccharimonadaceae bacterium]|jgi:multiple sugar transport system substrate-binding protein|nr:extracellular solute-binding protein [Candidatus Saccharimonadaceae bacterium]